LTEKKEEDLTEKKEKELNVKKEVDQKEDSKKEGELEK
jgi:hypothetical protein